MRVDEKSMCFFKNAPKGLVTLTTNEFTSSFACVSYRLLTDRRTAEKSAKQKRCSDYIINRVCEDYISTNRNNI